VFVGGVLSELWFSLRGSSWKLWRRTAPRVNLRIAGTSCCLGEDDSKQSLRPRPSRGCVPWSSFVHGSQGLWYVDSGIEKVFFYVGISEYIVGSILPWWEVRI